MSGIAAALAAGLAVIAWILLPPAFAARRRRRLAARSLDAAQRALLAEWWPGYLQVSPALAPKLDAMTAVRPA